MYKDPNHKPEMALSLTDFEALCGFVSHEELCDALQTYPELRACVGEDHTAALLLAGGDAAARKAALKDAFTALMTCPSDQGCSRYTSLFHPVIITFYTTVAEAIRALVSRLQAAPSPTPKEALILRLDTQYPADVGVLSAFFLNYLSLPAGQSIALPANVPHAYVSGQLVECMATSDNVIRAGLTPKVVVQCIKTHSIIHVSTR